MLENITKWLCKLFTKDQIIFLIKVLSKIVQEPNSKFKESLPEYPNYRKFEVDPEIPLEYQEKLVDDYKKLVKEKNIKPIKHRVDNRPLKHIRCPHCNAPSEFIYINNGKNIKSTQYQCKICKKTFCETPKKRITKYLCPHCKKALYKWKERESVRIYKCGNDRCKKYLGNIKKLSPEEKELRKEKSSQFKLRYIFRDYKISLKDIFSKELMIPFSKLQKSTYSLNTIGLILTFYISLGLSSRKTAFALNNIFGLRISHTSVARIAKYCSGICHNYNLKNIPKVTGKQAIDETYIKVKGKHHYVWLAIAKFRSIITAYQVSDTRSEIPAIKSIVLANNKFQNDKENSHLTIIADGNPSYQAATTFLKKEGIIISLKKVIGLENKDQTSKDFRYLKNIVERVNRTYKSYSGSCFGNIEGASNHLALAITDYNFLRPHSSLDYHSPVINNELQEIDIIQNRWAKIISSVK